MIPPSPQPPSLVGVSSPSTELNANAQAQTQTHAAQVDAELVRAAKEAKVDRRDADEREAIRRETARQRDAQRQKTKSPNWGGVLRSTKLYPGAEALPTKSHRGGGALPPGGKDGSADGAGGGVVGAVATSTTSVPKVVYHSSISPSEDALKSTQKKKKKHAEGTVSHVGVWAGGYVRVRVCACVREKHSDACTTNLPT